jgi:hypothetical protein
MDNTMDNNKIYTLKKIRKGRGCSLGDKSHPLESFDVEIRDKNNNNFLLDFNILLFPLSERITEIHEKMFEQLYGGHLIITKMTENSRSIHELIDQSSWLNKQTSIKDIIKNMCDYVLDYMTRNEGLFFPVEKHSELNCQWSLKNESKCLDGKNEILNHTSVIHSIQNHGEIAAYQSIIDYQQKSREIDMIKFFRTLKLQFRCISFHIDNYRETMFLMKQNV